MTIKCLLFFTCLRKITKPNETYKLSYLNIMVQQFSLCSLGSSLADLCHNSLAKASFYLPRGTTLSQVKHLIKANS